MLELKEYGPICFLACGTGLSKTLKYEQILHFTADILFLKRERTEITLTGLNPPHCYVFPKK